MKKIFLGSILAAIFSVSAFANYTVQGDSLYYNGNKIATLDYSYGWRVSCENGRNSGTYRILDGNKDHAFQVAIIECKK